MPNCFKLISKATGEAASLCKVDEELCAVLDVPVSPVRYVEGWFDCIGLGLALGCNWEQLTKKYHNDEPLLKCIAYLSEHYTSDAWAER